MQFVAAMAAAKYPIKRNVATTARTVRTRVPPIALLTPPQIAQALRTVIAVMNLVATRTAPADLIPVVIVKYTKQD